MATPLPTPSGVVHIRFLHNLAGPTLYGTAVDWAYTGGPPTTGTLSSIASLARTAYNGNLDALLPEAWSLHETRVTDLANPDTVEGIDTTVVTGGRAGTSALDSKCAVLIYFPDRRYRGSRPKGFFPWGVDGDLGSGKTWSGAFQTEVNGDWANFRTALDGQAVAGTTLTNHVSVSYITEPYHVVTSPTTGRARNVGTPRNPPLVMPILTTSLSAKVGTQRRRLNP